MILINLRVPAPDPDEVTDAEIQYATVMLTWLATRLLDPRFANLKYELEQMMGDYR